jgi:hypothetical protein
MNALSGVKELAQLVQKLGKIDLYKKVVEVVKEIGGSGLNS